MNKVKQVAGKVLLSIVAIVAILSNCCADAFADNEFSVSPMNQKVILYAGETYTGSFIVTNPQSNQRDFYYDLSVSPFFVDDEYKPTYENNGDYNQIVNWVELSKKEGVIVPNSSEEIYFNINVPEDAPAGGQYAAIMVTSKDQPSTEGSLNIQNKLSIAHLIYAEIAGATVREGEITDANVPSFLFSGNISGVSNIKNSGNVHSIATYKMRVYPLFSDEEVYTNEEDPENKIILPGRALMNTTQWEETPMVGIFNVVYTVDFEGVTTEVKKIVVVCPIWLLAIIVAVILSIILWFVSRIKSSKKNRQD